MNGRIFSTVEKYAAQLSAMAGSGSNWFKIIANLGGERVETTDKADLTCLREEDIRLWEVDEREYWLEHRLLNRMPELDAVVLSQTPYCLRAALSGRTMTAALDDMAQIAGYRIFTVEYDWDTVCEALRNASGCFVRDRYTITAGRSLYEAVVALQVLEKSAEVNLKAEVIGGAKFLPADEAEEMRRMYLEKYSRREQEVRKTEGR